MFLWSCLMHSLKLQKKKSNRNIQIIKNISQMVKSHDMTLRTNGNAAFLKKNLKSHYLSQEEELAQLRAKLERRFKSWQNTIVNLMCFQWVTWCDLSFFSFRSSSSRGLFFPIKIAFPFALHVMSSHLNVIHVFPFQLCEISLPLLTWKTTSSERQNFLALFESCWFFFLFFFHATFLVWNFRLCIKTGYNRENAIEH